MKSVAIVFTIAFIGMLNPAPARSEGTDDLVLVAGATGRTGRVVVEELLAQGFKVRAFVRDIERARTVLPKNIEYSQGDVRQRATIDPALNGVTAIICTIGASLGDPDNTPELVDYGGVRALADAAADAGLEHFVLVSSGGATQRDHVLNQRFNNVLIWKFKGEEVVRNSGVPYTIVRPGGLTDEPGGGKSLVLLQGDKRLGTISRKDVARVLVASLRIGDARGKTFELFNGDQAPSGDLKNVFTSLAAD